MQGFLTLVLSLVAIVAAVSCRAGGGGFSRDAVQRAWVLSEIPGGPALDALETVPTLTLINGGVDAGAGRLQGFAGCNRYSGSFALGEDGSLAVGPLAMTRMACGGAAGEVERALSLRIQRASACRVEGGVLVITGREGELRFAAAE